MPLQRLHDEFIAAGLPVAFLELDPQFLAYDVAQLIAERHTHIDPCPGADHKDRRDFKHRRPASAIRTRAISIALLPTTMCSGSRSPGRRGPTRPSAES